MRGAARALTGLRSLRRCRPRRPRRPGRRPAGGACTSLPSSWSTAVSRTSSASRHPSPRTRDSRSSSVCRIEPCSAARRCDGAGEPRCRALQLLVQPTGALGDVDVLAEVRGELDDGDVDTLAPPRRIAQRRGGEGLLECVERLTELCAATAQGLQELLVNRGLDRVHEASVARPARRVRPGRHLSRGDSSPGTGGLPRSLDPMYLDIKIDCRRWWARPPVGAAERAGKMGELTQTSPKEMRRWPVRTASAPRARWT